jgi:hypothetical protein
LTWHQGLSKKKITRVDRLDLSMRRFALGESNVSIDWPITRGFYEFGGDVNKWLKAVDKQHPQLATRPSEGANIDMVRRREYMGKQQHSQGPRKECPHCGPSATCQPTLPTLRPHLVGGCRAGSPVVQLV